MAPAAPSAAPPVRDPRALHLLLVIGVSAAFEALFLHHGIAWLFDEALPLYASMRLQRGGVLYADASFPFPPAYLLPAWIGYTVAPPGVIAARAIYAAFAVALCALLYLLARRLMAPRFALLAALLLAVAAPRAHLAHYLFGYRYLAFSVLALLLLDRRLRTGRRGNSFAAGLAAGAALLFRQDPALVTAGAFGLAILATERDPRRWLLDGAAFGAGLLLVATPVLAWLAAGVGLGAVWRETTVRQGSLLVAQLLPVPPLAWPDAWSRDALETWFVAVQYRAYAAVYAGYGLGLALVWIRARRRGEPFRHGLLLAVVAFGAVFFLRTLGRADEAHLVSALPPTCVVLAHALGLAFHAVWRRVPARPRRRAWAESAGVLAALAAWVFLIGSDRYLPAERRGTHALASLQGVSIRSAEQARHIDRVVAVLRAETRPDQTVLNLAWSPLFHVLADRPGPGGLDVVTPGSFLDAAEEAAFVARLAAAPPAAVIWPAQPFDGRPERDVRRTAPRVASWVQEHYEPRETAGRWILWFPRDPQAH
jgi:4-amino-4-deoxy-L-arabinose transferase-like glycosyltransferase